MTPAKANEPGYLRLPDARCHAGVRADGLLIGLSSRHPHANPSGPAHVVVVVGENHLQANVIGNRSAPFINALAANGVMMAQAFAETHPS